MKDAKGHGSNGKGGKRISVWDRMSPAQRSDMLAKDRANPQKGTYAASRALQKGQNPRPPPLRSSVKNKK